MEITFCSFSVEDDNYRITYGVSGPSNIYLRVFDKRLGLGYSGMDDSDVCSILAHITPDRTGGYFYVSTGPTESVPSNAYEAPPETIKFFLRRFGIPENRINDLVEVSGLISSRRGRRGTGAQF